MKKNKFTSYLLILLVCLLLEVFTSSNIKAATYQVNNFASLKSAIDSAPAGTHDVEMTADFDFTGPAITIPANVTINLHSDSSRHTLRRVNTFLGVFFHITNANSSMNVTNLIIDGQKSILTSNPSGTMFNLSTDNTRSLTLGKDLIVKNNKKTGAGMVVVNNSGIVNVEANAEFYDNEQLNNTAGIFYNNGENSVINIKDDVLIHDNFYTVNSDQGVVLRNSGQATISDNVKIYNNGTMITIVGAVISNFNSSASTLSSLIIKDDVEIYQNHSATVVGTDGVATIFNQGCLYIKDNVKLHDNYGGNGGVISMDRVIVGESILDISDNVEIYNNESTTTGGAFMIGSLTVAGDYQYYIYDNVKIYNNKGNSFSGVGNIQGTTKGKISGNVQIYGNQALGNGAGVFNVVGSVPNGLYPELEISGNVKIFDNDAINGVAGALRASTNGTLIIKENVEIFNNHALINGGGIVSSSTGALIMDGNVKVHDNKAASGAGMYLEGNNTIGGNVEIYNNEASGDASNINNHGGGIYLNNAANKTIIKDNVQIYDNKTTNDNTPNNDGGGIYINASVVTPVQILDKVSITNNEAIRDGGGIFTQEYEDLIVSKDVLFNNNKAIVGYNEDLPVIDPTNYAIYQTNVLVPNNKWTTNRTYGYNNYDINYA
ncbi:MAG: hypothetical protein LBT75_00605, partial [Bacilli bacterium]|nr:hypothetical protein [Bacilli bacterium]